MQHGDTKNTIHFPEDQGRSRNWFTALFGEAKTILMAGFVVVIILVAILIVVWLIAAGGDTHRSESYRKTSGAAGLEATISYGDKKPAFNFNVYIFRDDGQQIAVVRPDKDGKV